MFCKKHAEHGMVDVRSKRCSYHGCMKGPLLNFAGGKPRAYCKQHAVDGMIGIYTRHCSNSSCMTRAK